MRRQPFSLVTRPQVSSLKIVTSVICQGVTNFLVSDYIGENPSAGFLGRAPSENVTDSPPHAPTLDGAVRDCVCCPFCIDAAAHIAEHSGPAQTGLQGGSEISPGIETQCYWWSRPSDYFDRPQWLSIENFARWGQSDSG